MKVKTLVAMVATSMLAVSMAYAVPPPPATQLVDDSTSSQSPTNDATANPGATDSNSTGGNPMATPPGDANNSAGTSNGMGDSSGANSGDDETTPDQPSSDSDY